jgi:hypothetical protein
MTYTDALLKVANDPYIYWVQLAEDGVIEFYLDNHMLQTFRACEARGILDFIEGYTGSGRIWFLDFGTVVHDLMESYYVTRYFDSFDIHSFCMNDVARTWNDRKMDYYKTLDPKHPWRKHLDALGGVLGLMNLMAEYTALFQKDNERFRVVGAELYFGKGKEVPLLDSHYSEDMKQLFRVNDDAFPFRVYLCGKIIY